MVRNHCDPGWRQQLVRRRCLRLGESATAGAEEPAVPDSAHVESGLQMAAYRINAFDVQMPDTRGAMRAGSFMRSFFASSAQMPHFITPGIDQVSGGLRVRWGRR